MAMMIFGLLAGAVYSLSTAALETSKAVKREHQASTRLDAFLRVLRDTFVNLPPDAVVYLTMEKSPTGAPVPAVVFEGAPGAFGIPSLGTGALVLAAKPLADGTREFALLLRQEQESSFSTRIDPSGASWIPLFADVESVVWRFKRSEEEWVEEWPKGAGRPNMVRVTFNYAEAPGRPVDMQFWVPSVEQQTQPTPEKKSGDTNAEDSPDDGDIPEQGEPSTGNKRE